MQSASHLEGGASNQGRLKFYALKYGLSSSSILRKLGMRWMKCGGLHHIQRPPISILSPRQLRVTTTALMADEWDSSPRAVNFCSIADYLCRSGRRLESRQAFCGFQPKCRKLLSRKLKLREAYQASCHAQCCLWIQTEPYSSGETCGVLRGVFIRGFVVQLLVSSSASESKVCPRWRKMSVYFRRRGCTMIAKDVQVQS
jgi:hypothetical protein